jgi:exonuclease SbcC
VRPTKLQVEGFTSFKKKVEVDFGAMTLFTITGPTGAGKTSLIDAIIYALYGCTPRISSGFSELISQGSDRLSVLLEFSSAGRRYRVSRFMKKGKKGVSSDARFEEWTEGDWVPKCDKPKQVTQEIERLVGLDFNGFTKSVVLPQGQFDEFLRGDVAERRRILSDLLQLDIYGSMMKRANELAQSHRTEMDHLERQIAVDFADATPERLAALEAERGQFSEQRQQLEGQMDTLRGVLPTALRLGQAKTELSRDLIELADLSPKLADTESAIQTEAKTAEASVERIAQLEADIASNSYDPELYTRLSVLLGSARHLDGLKKKVHEMTATESDLRAKLERARNLSIGAKADHEKAVSALESAQRKVELDNASLTEALTKYGSPEAIDALIATNDRRVKAEVKKASIEGDLAKQTASQGKMLRDLAQIGKQLQVADSTLATGQATLDSLRGQHAASELRGSMAAGDACPVCLQIVTSIPETEEHPPIEAAKLAVESAQSQVDALRNRKSSTEGGLGPLQEIIERLESDIENLAAGITQESAQIESVLGKPPGPDCDAELRKLQQEVQGLRTNCLESAQSLQCLMSQERLAQKKFLDIDSQVAVALAALDQATITLDAQRVDCARMEAELGKYAELPVAEAAVELQATEKRKREDLDRALEAERKILLESKDKVSKLASTKEGLRLRVDMLTGSTEQKRREVEEFSSSLMAALPDLNLDASGKDDVAAQIEGRQKSVSDQFKTAQTKFTERQEQIGVAEKKMKRAAEIKAEVEIHSEKNAVARELGLLLKSDHFVAYIQQEAYQRLAADGSAHLSTLSSNRYSFDFDKDEFVVVDHWNADEPRSVSTLSGGESFLASLALALALAEGLTALGHSRGRAALESLFLDEGFGMLDSETLDTVIGGLEILTASDRMVGIVSHIPELSARLPSRIKVLKAAGGSTVEVS